MDVLLSGCVASGVQLERKKIRFFFFSENILALIFTNLLCVRKCEVSLVYSLPRKSSLSSDSNKTFCMLGHCTQTSGELVKQSRRWSMGTVLLFNGRTLISSPDDELCYCYYTDINLLSLIGALFYRMYVRTHDCASGLMFVWDCCYHYADCSRGLLFCEWPTASL